MSHAKNLLRDVPLLDHVRGRRGIVHPHFHGRFAVGQLRLGAALGLVLGLLAVLHPLLQAVQVERGPQAAIVLVAAKVERKIMNASHSIHSNWLRSKCSEPWNRNAYLSRCSTRLPNRLAAAARMDSVIPVGQRRTRRGVV